MLIDDVTLGAFPVPGFGPKKYKVEIEASNNACEGLIVDAIERHYPNHNLTDAIYEFAQECIQCVAAYGQAPYEIVYLSDEEGAEKAFLLTLIIPSSFVTGKRGFQQYVPAAEIAGPTSKGQLIDLPADKIHLFELPAEMKRQYEFMMESLSYLGGALIPQFAMANFVTQTIPFSQPDYFRSREIAVAHATRDIGWNARNYSSEYELEFYVWYRQLRFYRFQCFLRNLVIETLNEGLSRIGKGLGFEAKLSMSGLPTVGDADVAMKRLISGDLKTFLEVLEPF